MAEPAVDLSTTEETPETGVQHKKPSEVTIIEDVRSKVEGKLPKQKKLAAITNAYQGCLLYLEKYKKLGSGVIRQIGWFLMCIKISTERKIPIPIAVVHETWEKIMPYEKTLFNMLRSEHGAFSNLNPEGLKEYLESTYGIQIKDVNDFYDRLDDILEVIFVGEKKK